jgi:hypothetical protein
LEWRAVALCSRRRYIPIKRDELSRFIFLFAHDLLGKPLHTFPDHALARGNNSARPENDMRAEIERLVEEIKQSVGLLRRHL